MNETFKYNVYSSISEIRELFINYPNIFLTEEDLRFHLCNSLYQYFSAVETTEDGDKSIPLHTEVRWYGNGDLKYRSDVVLVDVSNLRVLNYDQLPSKGYGFNIPKAIIELKLRRPNGKPNHSFLRSIQYDIRKLAQLKQIFYNAQGQHQTDYWLIVFDKKSDMTDQIPTPDGITVVYKYNSEANNRVQRTLHKVSGPLTRDVRLTKITPIMRPCFPHHLMPRKIWQIHIKPLHTRCYCVIRKPFLASRLSPVKLCVAVIAHGNHLPDFILPWRCAMPVSKMVNMKRFCF